MKSSEYAYYVTSITLSRLIALTAYEVDLFFPCLINKDTNPSGTVPRELWRQNLNLWNLSLCRPTVHVGNCGITLHRLPYCSIHDG